MDEVITARTADFAALPTPLQPRDFFSGVWSGRGTFSPLPFFRWCAPVEEVRYEGRTTWLSNTIWVVEEWFEPSAGHRIERTMFSRLVAPDRIHVTADDMPGGADLTLSATGFDFAPYYMWVPYRGRKWWIRCIDRNRVDSDGVIHDTVNMYFLRLPVATMHLTVTVRREPPNTALERTRA